MAVAVSCFLSGLAMLLGLYSVARALRPLRILTSATEELATGHLDFPLPIKKTNDEIGQLTGAFEKMRTDLKRYLEEMKDKLRIDQEMSLAREMQAKFCHSFQTKSNGRTIDTSYHPCSETGGDFVYFKETSKGFFYLMGDVSGHGLASAFITASMHGVLNSINFDDEKMTLDEIMKTLNKVMIQSLSGNLMTSLALKADMTKNQFEMCRASHTFPVFRNLTGQWEFFTSLNDNPALGENVDAEFKSDFVSMDEITSIVIFTDGLIEQNLAKNRPLQNKGLLRLLNSMQENISTKNLLDQAGHNATLPIDDDITLTVITNIE
jgi:sigma-B regulation protein RsbU (phosphoserine phosphatase)